MTTTSDNPSPSPRAVLAEPHRRMVDDPLTVPDLYAEDIVHERPFARPGIPRTVVGREANREILAMALRAAPVRFTGFRDLVIHDGADPEEIFAEYVAQGVLTATGETFEIGNIPLLRIRDGLVVSVRDYADPMPVSAVFARAEKTTTEGVSA